MRKFPGEIMRGGGNHHSVILNDEQVAWLCRWYPVTENDRLAKAMGICVGCMRNQAKKYGLKKSEEGLSLIRKHQGRKMARTFEQRGLYAAKRGHPCSDATIEGNRRRWERVRRGESPDPITSFKESDPEGFQEYLRRQSDVHKEVYKKEVRRMIYGLGKKTRLNIVLTPFTRSQLVHRYAALKRGYLLDEDCSEGTEGRYVIYYDGQTMRSKKFEDNLIKDGFTLKEDE